MVLHNVHWLQPLCCHLCHFHCCSMHRPTMSSTTMIHLFSTIHSTIYRYCSLSWDLAMWVCNWKLYGTFVARQLADFGRWKKTENTGKKWSVFEFLIAKWLFCRMNFVIYRDIIRWIDQKLSLWIILDECFVFRHETFKINWLNG